MRQLIKNFAVRKMTLISSAQSKILLLVIVSVIAYIYLLNVQSTVEREQTTLLGFSLSEPGSKLKPVENQQKEPKQIFFYAANIKKAILEQNHPVKIQPQPLTSSPEIPTIKASPELFVRPKDHNENQDKEQRESKQKSKKILIWNNYWGSKTLLRKIFAQIINDKCPNSSCRLTFEKSELTTSDAVLFHLLDLHLEGYHMPEYRDPKQIWIAMSFEPPHVLNYNGVNLSRFNKVFNRTMTYRADADIVVRHGQFLKIQQDTNRKFSKIPTWVNSQDDIEQRNYAQGKKKLVAWFVSSQNCTSQSNREIYVQKLQQYIPVDVYGSCGPYKCGNRKTLINSYSVEHDECYKLLSITYKFYLAFENSVCEDYVTEKLYNHLKLNLIPVVFGGGNYSFFAPPYSVIDATKFTPKELGEYLHLLDSNDELYNKYFNWKKDYYIEAHDGIPLICDLCDEINRPEWEAEKKVYDKFDTWYEGKCYPGYEGNETIPYCLTRRKLNATWTD